MRAVKFDTYGPVSVLEVRDVETPEVGVDEILVAVKAAGINPGEAKIREGLLDSRWPATFPSGQGSDLAGTVAAVGDGVERFTVGDEVIGFSNTRSTHAELVAIAADQAIKRPAGVPWEVAGALFVAGTTAYAMVEAVGLEADETVLVAGASGGVGVFAVQLARRRGARVIGIASERHDDWLTAHDVRRVGYLRFGGWAVDASSGVAAEAAASATEGLAARIEAVSDGHRVDAVLDCHGGGYVVLGLELGVAPERIDTIADFDASVKYPGVQMAGNADGARAEVLSELAEMVVAGELEVPIAARFPLEQVRDAYIQLANEHPLGKIVLVP